MISVFKNNDVVNIFLLLPYTVILRVYSIINPEKYQATDLDPFWVKYFFSLIPSALLQSIIAIILIYIQALLINILANKHNLFRSPSALGGVTYVIIVSATPELQILSPALIGGTFVLISIYSVFSTYKQTRASTTIFEASLSSTAAVAIYPPNILVPVTIFIGLSIMRNFKMIERLQFFLGSIAMTWIIGVFLFYFDYLENLHLDIIAPLPLISNINFSDITTISSFGVIFIMILISLSNYYRFMKKKGIDVRKKLSFFYWLLASSFVTLLLFEYISYQHLCFAAIPIAIFLSLSILMIRSRAITEFMHLVVVTFLFYIQFGPSLSL